MGEESPASAPMGAVFLSYASQDAEAAQKICEALRAAGIEVWFDKSELRGGEAWDRQIRKQIHDCALFVPVISAHSDARREGYFRREWKLATERTADMAEDVAFLLPVVIDSTPDATARVPDRFREVQWSRLPDGKASPPFIERVQRLLSPEQAHSPTTVRPATGPVSTAVPTSRQRVPETSVAVLPFVDLSEKHDQEYFADGIAEETLNQLARIPRLKVIGRTASFQFKGKADDLRKVGEALGAAYVLEGSVRRAGDRIRVTAQLVDSQDGTHRWSGTYDRTVADVLRMQDEIALGLARALQLEVSARPRVSPRTPEAYDSYLRGLHAREGYDQAAFEEAIADFRHSLELDSSFALAAEQLARALLDQAEWFFVPPRVGFEQARAAAITALRLDSKSALAHSVLASVRTWYDWDWAGAERESNAAIALATNDPTIKISAAEPRIADGRWADAARMLRELLSVDPLQASAHQELGWTYLRLGRLAEAEAALRRVLEISGSYSGGHHDLGIVLLLEGKTDAALIEMEKETPLGGRAAGMAVVYQALHRLNESDAELAKLESEHSDDMAMWIAEAHAFRDKKDFALSWLDRAYVQKDAWLWQVKGDPLFKKLHGDPRYKAFLRKMNLPE
jgi:TolB-like protein